MTYDVFGGTLNPAHSKRSRSHIYENCHNCMAASEVCCCGHCATAASMGLHIIWLLRFL